MLYWPFLRVIVFGRALAVAAGGVTAAVLRLALEPLNDSTWEAGFFWARGIQAAGAILVVVFLMAAVDYALVRLEADRSRAALRAWLAGVRFAATRPALTFGVWGGAGVVLALALGVFVVLRELRQGDAPGGCAIAVAFVLQQVFMLARTWLRVGLLGAEQHAVSCAREPSPGIDCDVVANRCRPLQTPPPSRRRHRSRRWRSAEA